MIVQCVGIYSEATGKCLDKETNGILTKNNYYFVIEMDCARDGVRYRVLPDIGTGLGHPVLIRSSDFRVISGKLPLNWVINRVNPNFCTLGPKRWSEFEEWDEDFWDDWCDCKPRALKCYEEEFEIIKSIDADVLEEYNLKVLSSGKIVPKGYVEDSEI